MNEAPRELEAETRGGDGVVFRTSAGCPSLRAIPDKAWNSPDWAWRSPVEARILACALLMAKT
ncbi:hypothetical protein TRAPUB_8300 [Trametes pubescens]|uniref:Uncharacterized protein n=1 Tax=Trametes pubescens TaxID=154538 RepID=A0A1M2W5K1_TRAPU|nr:hypothetical protein TRAPUB_8300 [Trametes pubescens]